MLPGTGKLQLTNLQIVGQSVNLSSGFDVDTDIPAFRELSYEQVENDEFNVYRDPLLFKPIPSYLVGWDFPLNPAQLWGSTVSVESIGANTSYYAWDQTIVFQSVTGSAIITRNTTERGFTISPQVDGQFAIIQYLPAPVVNQILLDNISLNMRANCATGTSCTGTISLWYTTGSLPIITPTTYKSLIATLDANGKPATFNGTWTEVPQSVSNEAIFTLTPTITDFGFNKWTSPGIPDASTATYFAVVIGFAPLVAATNINPQIISVGLSSGQVPTIPAPQTPDEVLRECQYYYEQSYVPGSGIIQSTVAGTVTQVGMNTAPAQFLSTGGLGRAFLQSFYQQYKQTKYSIPTHLFWSPATGAKNEVSVAIYQSGTLGTASSGSNPANVVSTSWSISASASYDGCALLCQNTTILANPNEINPVAGDEVIVQYHYTLDSTLGGPIRT